MDDKRWLQVSELFQKALQKPSTERRAFLQESCEGDSELMESVLKLLEADSESEGFMEKPYGFVE